VDIVTRGVLTGAWSELKRRRVNQGIHDHYIICGYGRVGRRIAAELRNEGGPSIAVDFNDEALNAAQAAQENWIRGKGTEDEDLEQAGIDRARGLIVASDSDADNLYITLSARSRRPELSIVARATDEDAEKKLRLAGADRVVLPYATAGRVMANLMVRPQVAAFVNVLTSVGADLSFEEIEVRAECGQGGKTIRELDIFERTGAYVVAVRKEDGSFDTRPSKDTVLETGDVIVGVGAADEIRALENLFEPRERVGR